MLRCDLHVHSNYSFDTDDENTMESYCLEAINRGVDVICFTDHIEYNMIHDTFSDFKFTDRIEEFNRLKEKYQGKVKLLLGYEVGQPHRHKKVVEYLRSLGCDMIIGSIHFSEELNLDYIDNPSLWERRYDEMVLEMIECANFDVVGHLDVLKKWHGESYTPDKNMQKKAVEKAIEKGLVLEINASSYHRNGKEPMPGYDIVEYYKECGGEYITINSDAHRVKDLSFGYDRVLENLPQGLKLCYFEKGELKEAK